MRRLFDTGDGAYSYGRTRQATRIHIEPSHKPDSAYPVKVRGVKNVLAKDLYLYDMPGNDGHSSDIYTVEEDSTAQGFLYAQLTRFVLCGNPLFPGLTCRP